MKSKTARTFVVLILVAVLSLSVFSTVSADPPDLLCDGIRVYVNNGQVFCMTVKDSCKIKAVSPSSIAHGDSFMVTYKGDLTSIRFRHLSGGIAGFLAPDRTDVGTTFGPGAWVWPFIFGETQIGIDSVAYFTNQNADGTRVFEPGSYYVKCFGPGGSVGNPILVTLTP